MGNVILHEIPFANGEMGIQRELVSGGYPCPICGRLWVDKPPMRARADGGIGAVWALGDYCECGVVMGDDLFDLPHWAIGYMHHWITLLRGEWLDTVNWFHSELQQLEMGLGITEHQARQEYKYAKEMQELLRKISEGDEADVFEVIERGRVPLNTPFGTSIQLYDAVHCGNLNIVKCLVEHGASIDVPGIRPETPFTLAESCCVPEIESYLHRVLADGGMPESPSD
jgi:hypothetical protein